jgi:hypothetical protein
MICGCCENELKGHIWEGSIQRHYLGTHVKPLQKGSIHCVWDKSKKTIVGLESLLLYSLDDQDCIIWSEIEVQLTNV